MKLVFFGTASFAVPALRAVADSVCLVVSQPDQPSGRGLNVHESPVKQAANELGLPVITPVRCRAKEVVEHLRSLEADAFLVAAYGQILPESLLTAAKAGAINLHGSILPKYRGAAPIQRAVAAGEAKSGVTLMQMDRGMDTGDIIAIETVAIGQDETAGELYGRLAHLAGEMAVTWMSRIVSGDYPRQVQDETLMTHAPKLEREDGRLSFEMPILTAYNQFRGVTPSPGAFIETDVGTLKIKSARMTPNPATVPGQVGQVKPDLTVGFSGGELILQEVQPEGRRAMSGSDFANGARIRPGQRLQKVESS